MLIKSFNAGYKSKTAKIYAAQNAKERYKQRDTHQQTFECVLLGFIVFPPFRPPFGIFHHFSVVHTEDNCPVRIVAIYNLAEKREVGREKWLFVDSCLLESGTPSHCYIHICYCCGFGCAWDCFCYCFCFLFSFVAVTADVAVFRLRCLFGWTFAGVIGAINHKMEFSKLI